METQGTAKPTPSEPAGQGHDNIQAEAAQHVAEAHRLLTTLRRELEKHPQLDEAIEKLEMALATLTVSSGGML